MATAKYWLQNTYKYMYVIIDWICGIDMQIGIHFIYKKRNGGSLHIYDVYARMCYMWWNLQT